MPDFRIQEIASGSMAVFGGVCNRGIVADQGNVLVIDSGISGAEAEPLYAAAQQHRKQGMLTLFNTHPHGDHVFGNQVFAASPIIAHQGVRDNLVETGVETLAMWKQNPQLASMVDSMTITPPTVTFQDTLTIFVGKIEVQLLYMGIAHSPSDSVAWLPQSRTLFTGDLLFNGLVPAMPPGGNSANWLRALTRLEQLDALHAIPGHGPIQSPDALHQLYSWIEELRGRVDTAIKDGWDPETSVAKISAEMEAVAPRTTKERLPRAIQQVYAEISQERGQ